MDKINPDWFKQQKKQASSNLGDFEIEINAKINTRRKELGKKKAFDPHVSGDIAVRKHEIKIENCKK